VAGQLNTLIELDMVELQLPRVTLYYLQYPAVHDICMVLARLTWLNIKIFVYRQLYLGTSNCKLCLALYKT